MNNGEPTTEHVYAWLAMLPNGEPANVEGIICTITVEGTMPLMATDLAVVESMKPIVGRWCGALGVGATLVRFDRSETLQVIEAKT